MPAHSTRGRIVAVLGPTNTGKTHLAVERMLGHRTGMIGCPLRLLAREIYDRVVAARGAGAVALVTGEEKIVPARPHYFVCTVESMPLDRRVEFLAIDEIQLAADPERGHIFTDRLLHARGLSETMFLGAETIRPLLRRLVPDAEYVSRPRFSRLSYLGPKKISRLPRRSAVIAFSAEGVYELAEILRRQRGGTAVVLGALSPRTRNAQVAMYQDGEVDYLVATDAIGMGVNMDVDHVAFSALRKFDGRRQRDLSAQEVAQIAGRAGRHMRDGTFGTVGEVGPLDPAVIEAVEEHRFDPLTHLYYRNARPRFSSLSALVNSLEAPPPAPQLVRVRDATDHLSLRALAAVPDIARMASGHDQIRLLWEVCQIPDFSKTLFDSHIRLLGQIYRHLSSEAAELPDEWVSRHVDRLDRGDGDIDALVTRIAHIRTWNYVAHRPGWLADARGLQARSRAIEDRLSDALHQRLTQRFVDRRNAVLIRRMTEGAPLLGAVTGDGAVVVEGEHVGQLTGFRFVADADLGGDDKALRAAAMRALRSEMAHRVARCVRSGDGDFALGEDRLLRWRGEPVARLASGADILAPAVEVLDSEFLDTIARERLRRRLADWLRRHLGARVKPLRRLLEAPLAGPPRGLAYQLAESLGSVPYHAVRDLVAALTPEQRQQLGRLGVRFGTESIYLPAMLKPDRIEVRVLLWSVRHRQGEVAVPPPGRVSVELDGALPEQLLEASGYRSLGSRAIRVDILERLAAAARQLSRAGPFAADPRFAALAGCRGDELDGILTGLGYRRVGEPGEVRFARTRIKRKGERRRPQRGGHEPASPFADLKRLKLGS